MQISLKINFVCPPLPVARYKIVLFLYLVETWIFAWIVFTFSRLIICEILKILIIICPLAFFKKYKSYSSNKQQQREVKMGRWKYFLSQAQPKVFFLAFLLGMQKFFHRCTRKKNVQTSLFKSKTFSIKYFFTFYPERNLCRKKITEFIYLTMDQIYKNISNIFFQLTICDW